MYEEHALGADNVGNGEVVGERKFWTGQVAWIRRLSVILESGAGFSNGVNVGPRYQNRHRMEMFLEEIPIKLEEKEQE